MGRATGTWAANVPPISRDDDAYLQREYHPTLVAALTQAGGSWFAGDYYSRPAEIVAAVRAQGATALRLDMRDLSLLDELRDVRYLDVSSDGRPVLNPIASLHDLRSLYLHVSALRGELDPLAFPHLRWLTLPLGGRGGAAVLPSILRGHPRLEHLRVRETRARSIGELIASYPRLQSFSVSYADHIRSPGDLGPVAGTLTELNLHMVPGLRSLEGIEVASRLERVALRSSSITDLGPLARLPNLRQVDVVLAGGAHITDVRDLV